MVEYRVTFVFNETEEKGARKWPSEAEARAYAAALQKSRALHKIRLESIEGEERPVRLSLKAVDESGVE